MKITLGYLNVPSLLGRCPYLCILFQDRKIFHPLQWGIPGTVHMWCINYVWELQSPTQGCLYGSLIMAVILKLCSWVGLDKGFKTPHNTSVQNYRKINPHWVNPILSCAWRTKSSLCKWKKICQTRLSRNYKIVLLLFKLWQCFPFF